MDSADARVALHELADGLSVPVPDEQENKRDTSDNQEQAGTNDPAPACVGSAGKGAIGGLHRQSSLKA